MSARPIIIKRIKKVQGGHHGGAWKVAYADFVTAMMAFFLLLWLLNAVSQEQLQGISDYFAPITMHASTSGGGGLLQGKTLDSRGVFNSVERRDGPPATSDSDDSETEETNNGPEAVGGEPDAEDSGAAGLSPREREKRQFRTVETQLRATIEGSPELKPLANSVLIDDTPEGLRIQIIDQEGLPMFPRGSSEMYAHTRKLLELVARVITQVPQSVRLSGHTDATRYSGGADYSNWELSVDRANAARRMLAHVGVTEGRIAAVVGKAATDPLLPDDPSAPGNRRLTLTLLRGTGSH